MIDVIQVGGPGWVLFVGVDASLEFLAQMYIIIAAKRRRLEAAQQFVGQHGTVAIRQRQRRGEDVRHRIAHDLNYLSEPKVLQL